MVPFGSIELYVVTRFIGSLSSLLFIDLKRIKKANPNPNIIQNKSTKNGKTSLATPIIMAKYFPYDGNTWKNIKNLKFNNTIVIDEIWINDSPPTSQYIDVIIGKIYAPTSIHIESILISQ